MNRRSTPSAAESDFAQGLSKVVEVPCPASCAEQATWTKRAPSAGILVHAICPVCGLPMLRDPHFPVAVHALHLRRSVEMRQWEETRPAHTSLTSFMTCHLTRTEERTDPDDYSEGTHQGHRGRRSLVVSHPTVRLQM